MFPRQVVVVSSMGPHSLVVDLVRAGDVKAPESCHSFGVIEE